MDKHTIARTYECAVTVIVQMGLNGELTYDETERRVQRAFDIFSGLLYQALHWRKR